MEFKSSALWFVCEQLREVDGPAEKVMARVLIIRLLCWSTATGPANVDGHEILLLQRSLHIISAYISDNAAVERYLRLLLRPMENYDLHKGFHLEYYGDLPRGVPVQVHRYDRVRATRSNTTDVVIC